MRFNSAGEQCCIIKEAWSGRLPKFVLIFLREIQTATHHGDEQAAS